MSVSQVKELYNRSSSHNFKNERSYERVWRVITTDGSSDDATVVENGWVSSTGISAGTVHPNDPYAYAKEISTSCVSEDGRVWEVSCSYGHHEFEDVTNPLSQPAQISYSFNHSDKIVEEDKNGVAVLNSADDPFDEPITIPDSHLCLSIQHNEATFPIATARAYVNAVNSDTWQGGDPRQWLCSEISASREHDAEFGFFYSVSYRFEFRADTWDTKVLDQGTRELVGGVKKQIYISSTPVSNPVLLDGSGAKLPDGGTPKYKTFRCLPELPFTSVFTFS